MARLVDAQPRLVTDWLMPVEATAAPRPQLMRETTNGGDVPVVALVPRAPHPANGRGPAGTDVSLLASALEADLTRREREVLSLLCLRLTDAEIAEQLFLSTRTINSHVAHILAKLGAANRRRAAMIAVRLGLI